MDLGCFSSAEVRLQHAREKQGKYQSAGSYYNVYYVIYKAMIDSFEQFGRDGIKRTGARL